MFLFSTKRALCLSMILLIWFIPAIFGQACVTVPTIQCSPSPITLGVPPSGVVFIDSALINASLTFGPVFCNPKSSVVSPSQLGCSDIGLPLIAITAVNLAATIIEACPVSLQDYIDPVARCLPSIQLNLSASGTAFLFPGNISNGSSDNCNIVAQVVVPNEFGCGAARVAPSTATLTVTDQSGNSNSCNSIVTVMDTTPPIMTCRANFNISSSTVVTVSDLVTLASDACGVQLSVSPSIVPCNSSMQTTTVTATGVDPSGNTANCSVLVTCIPLTTTTVAPPSTSTTTITQTSTPRVTTAPAFVVESCLDLCSLAAVQPPVSISCQEAGRTLNVSSVRLGCNNAAPSSGTTDQTCGDPASGPQLTQWINSANASECRWQITNQLVDDSSQFVLIWNNAADGFADVGEEPTFRFAALLSSPPPASIEVSLTSITINNVAVRCSVTILPSAGGAQQFTAAFTRAVCPVSFNPSSISRFTMVVSGPAVPGPAVSFALVASSSPFRGPCFTSPGCRATTAAATTTAPPTNEATTVVTRPATTTTATTRTTTTTQTTQTTTTTPTTSTTSSTTSFSPTTLPPSTTSSMIPTTRPVDAPCGDCSVLNVTLQNNTLTFANNGPQLSYVLIVAKIVTGSNTFTFASDPRCSFSSSKKIQCRIQSMGKGESFVVTVGTLSPRKATETLYVQFGECEDRLSF